MLAILLRALILDILLFIIMIKLILPEHVNMHPNMVTVFKKEDLLMVSITLHKEN